MSKTSFSGPVNSTTGYQVAGVAVITSSGTMAETALTFTDVTTNNVSTSLHGFVPKAPNDATKFLDGTGAFSVPSAGASNLMDPTQTTLTATAGVANHTTVAVQFKNSAGTNLTGPLQCSYWFSDNATGIGLITSGGFGSTVVGSVGGLILNNAFGGNKGALMMTNSTGALTFDSADTGKTTGYLCVSCQGATKIIAISSANYG